MKTNRSMNTSTKARIMIRLVAQMPLPWFAAHHLRSHEAAAPTRGVSLGRHARLNETPLIWEVTLQEGVERWASSRDYFKTAVEPCE